MRVIPFKILNNFTALRLFRSLHFEVKNLELKPETARNIQKVYNCHKQM